MLRVPIVCLFVSIYPAFAADTELCRNGVFPQQATTFGLAKVIGGPAHLIFGPTSRLAQTTALACRGRAYVLPRDTVITGVASGPYVCALFAGPAGGSAGYVRRDEIAPQPVPANPPLAAWLGTWRDGDNDIALSGDGAKLTADGEAYWPSAHLSAKILTWRPQPR